MAPDFRRAFRLNRRTGGDARRSVDDELEFHLEEAAEELMTAGWSEDDARAEARRRFGDVEGTRAFCADVQERRNREEGRTMVVDALRGDLRFALRTLRRSPGYTLLVVITLAFGVAANTTIFSVMRPYLLRALPFGQPDALVQVNQINPVTGWDMDRFSYPQVADWEEQARGFESMGAYSYGGGNVTGPEGPEQINYSRVTPDLFPTVLRVEPLLGRNFLPEEGQPGGDAVAILDASFWRRRYGGDPSILGRTVTLDGVQRTVVGIMPDNFVFPYGGIRMWLPIQDGLTAARGRMNLQIVGRLRPDWSAERARADLTQIQSGLAQRYPDADGRMSGVTVKPLREALNFAWDVLSISFKVLLGAVGFVLLIACVNVASLTLARGSGRSRELAVRAALGAPRRRLVHQLLTESILLALAGGALGVLAAVWVTGLVGQVVPEDIYRVGRIRVDGMVLAFSLAVTLLTPLAFGLWPALSASRLGADSGLRDGDRGGRGLSASRGRRVLVVAQVALAVILTTGAGLMVRSLGRVQDVDLGFDADRIVVAEVALPTNDYPTAQERLAYVDQAVAELERIPGVTHAAASTWLPLNHENYTLQVESPEMVGAAAEDWPLATLNSAHPGYFETMGVPLLQGRTFTASDGPDAEAVVVVGRSLAQRFWPDGDAVGRTLLAGDDPEHPDTYRVVGVVEDVRHSDLSGAGGSLQLYRPTLQGSARRYFLEVRTDGAPANQVSAVRAALLATAPDLPASIRPMNDVVQENLLQWSIGSVFLGAFGLGALLLATLGIYGLIAYSVAQQRREIGVRLALGASRAQIRRVVVGDGVRLALMGLGVGLALAVALARVVAAALYGVGPTDPVTLSAVALVFLGVALAASLVPAERASRTDPMGILRSE